MKKSTILAVLALAAGVSCTKQVPVSNNSPDVPLSFTAVTSPSTKTVYGEIGDAYNTSESFVAYAGWSAAEYTAPAQSITDYFPAIGETCSYASVINAWRPAHTYYWPKTGYLHFEAYSPAEASSYASHTWAGGVIFTDFAVSSSISTQYDLLFSDRVFDKTRGSYTITDTETNAYDDESDATYYNGVDLMFNHALSSIKFLVKTKADYSGNSTVITLTGLTINNAYSVGDFNPQITAAPAASYSKNPVWSGHDSETNYTVVTSGTQTVGYNSGTAQPLTGNPNIILLPQALNHAAATGHTVTVTLDYTLAQNGGSAIPQSATIQLKDLTTANGEVPVDTWEIGKCYTYTIVFGLDEIYFDPAVTNWSDVTVDPYEISY